jgi:hypothetical protein
MIEPSGLRIGTIGIVQKPKQPTVNPNSDPVIKQQLTNKKHTRHGFKRS